MCYYPCTVQRPRNESTSSLWDADSSQTIFKTIMWLQKFSVLLWGNHLDNRDTRQISSGQRVLEYGECQPLIYISSANSTLDECLVALGDAALSNGTCQDNIIWHKDMGNICDARTSCALNIQRKSEPLWFVAFCLRRATVAKVVCSQGFCGNGFTFLNLVKELSNEMYCPVLRGLLL